MNLVSRFKNPRRHRSAAVLGNERDFRRALPRMHTAVKKNRPYLWNPDRDSAAHEKKDPKSKPLTAEQITVVKNQLATIGHTDLFILNEVDNGVTRTDYRDVARELAQAPKMDYAYGVEFLEIDPLNLGLEKVKLDDKPAQDDILKSV